MDVEFRLQYWFEEVRQEGNIGGHIEEEDFDS